MGCWTNGVPCSDEPVHVKKVDIGGRGQYRYIQDAVDALAPLVSPTEKGLVEIAPGTYDENVVGRRNINLKSMDAFGPGGTVIIRSATGRTLTIPPFDVNVNGITILSTSPNPADAAVKILEDGLPASFWQSFFLNFYIVASGLARALENNPVGGGFIVGIWGGIDQTGGGAEAILCDGGGGMQWMGGGGGGNPATFAKLDNGGALFLQNGVSLSAALGTGRVIDADNGSILFCLDAMLQDGLDGVRARNGSALLLAKAMGLSGFPGTPVDTDAASPLFTGDVQLDGFGGAPLVGWNVLGPWLKLGNTSESMGTTGLGGPDQRPVSKPIAYKFFAMDRAVTGLAGTGTWLTWDGANWKTATDVIVP